MDDTYGDKWIRVLGNMCPIHLNTVFGKDVRIGENVVIDENVKIADRVFIGHGVVIRSNVVIGSDTKISHLVQIENDTKIGSNVAITPQCHITAHAVIEDRVFMGPMAMLLNTHRISHGRKYRPHIQGPTIKYGARIGAGSIIMPEVCIGREAQVGAGALVTKDIPPGECWFGVPAKFVKMVPEDEIYD